MVELKYTFKTDTLFKMLFVKRQDLLKQLTAELLCIPLSDIQEFLVLNPEMPPETMGDKFCRLDLNMLVNQQRVNLEIQVKNEYDYPERSLFNWSRNFSTALEEGNSYRMLPRTISVNIVAFPMFRCKEFHSEFWPLEITRHTPLCDKQVLHFFELPKVPEGVSADQGLELWLSLFKANTEEDFARLEELEVPVVQDAIGTYRQIVATDEFKEIERMRSLARHNEASALENAKRERDAIWQKVVSEKDSLLTEKNSLLTEKDSLLTEKNSLLTEKDALIAKLQAQLAGKATS